MKRSFIYLILGFFILMGCNSGRQGGLPADVVTNPNTANGEAKDNLPEIEFEREVYDFGKVIQGEIVTYGFKFTNTGKKDLVIGQVKTSCGCTVPKFPKIAIKPGESNTLTVSFNSEGRKGVQNKTITVVTNCQPNTTVLRIKAMVLTP
ncbi:MAG: DUF1573 domain-containing protein [Bacteroidales bacterium]|nr:DUF1573 domain-containing protein [Bacteroidales bacterium]